ncbi:serotriflin-like [Clinocottus analis]|uniref:serotriflin-like n=1 Tax=Clinocottus analis TaxID=304258 RepID=UPI0035BED1E8
MLEMKWSPGIAANAQRWANTCSMKHSTDSSRAMSNVKCGENLKMSSHPNTWSNAVQDWYDEVKDFRFGVGSTNGNKVGHYTQVVWYRSNEVGCGVAYCPNSEYKYFYVCQYCPAGNIIGRKSRPYKVGRSCAGCYNACRNKLCTNPCRYIDKYSNCASLKRQVTCSHKIVASGCRASCKCTSEIQ